MRVVLAGLAIVAGCDRIVGLDSFADATPAPATCTTFAIMDDFASGATCGSWGAPYTNPGGGQVTSGAMTLSVSPARATGAAAGCSSTTGFALNAGGAFVQLEQPLTGTDTYTGLQAAGTPGYAFGVSTGELAFTDLKVHNTYGRAAYDPRSMAWLRLRYDAGSVAADISADGTYWTSFATLAAAQPDAGQIALDASISADTSFTGPAKLAHFRVCR